jgi:predicted RNA methylase
VSFGPLRTLWLDLRFGGYAGGSRPTRFHDRQSTDVHNMSYRAIDDAMSGVDVSERDVLVDVGCGRGRVINYWLARALPGRIVGIELDPNVAARTRHRLRRHSQVEILSGDAVSLTPAEATVCFLFNPFGGAVLRRWHDALLARSTAERLTVIYVHPIHVEVFRASQRWSVRARPGAGFGDVAILERSPPSP